MPRANEVVITGIGVVCPLGVGCQAYWSALIEQRSGIRAVSFIETDHLPVRIAGEVIDFEPQAHVKPRKSLKVMARETTFAVAAAGMACADAGIAPSAVDPERFGVVLGADPIRTVLSEIEEPYRKSLDEQGLFQMGLFSTVGMQAAFPLGFLKVLPNMLASHISIAHDARGPNNTVQQSELSSLLAMAEAARIIERGHADVMLAGGASSRLHPFDFVRHTLRGGYSQRVDDPTAASRPFDSDRDGQVCGEGAAVFVLERREHALARGVEPLARVAGAASTYSPARNGQSQFAPALRRAIHAALRDAELGPAGIGHVQAHGLSTLADDQAEARVLADLLPDAPVTAFKSFFGNLWAAAGAVETVGSVLALKHSKVPPTLNYSRPDPACPVRVVHGEPAKRNAPGALILGHTSVGQAAALVLSAAD